MTNTLCEDMEACVDTLMERGDEIVLASDSRLARVAVPRLDLRSGVGGVLAIASIVPHLAEELLLVALGFERDQSVGEGDRAELESHGHLEHACRLGGRGGDNTWQPRTLSATAHDDTGSRRECFFGPCRTIVRANPIAIRLYDHVHLRAPEAWVRSKSLAVRLDRLFSPEVVFATVLIEADDLHTHTTCTKSHVSGAREA